MGPSFERPNLQWINAFLSTHRDIKRHRTRWGLYYNVSQFHKAWQKRLSTLRRVQKTAKDS